MARINIEDTLYRDDRFILLCSKIGGKAHAIGACVIAWDLAQYWFLKSPSHFIPRDEWRKTQYGSQLIEVGLAHEKDGGIYVSGTNSEFSWLISRQNASHRGGLKTKEKYQGQKRPNRAKQGSSSSSSSSSSFPSGTSEEIYTDRKFNFEEAYKEYPRKEGKKRGFKILEKQIKTEEDFQNFLEATKNYAKLVAEKGTEFIKHFSSFCNSWEDYITLPPMKSPPRPGAAPPLGPLRELTDEEIYG